METIAALQHVLVTSIWFRSNLSPLHSLLLRNEEYAVVVCARVQHALKNSGLVTCPFFCDGSCFSEPGCGLAEHGGAKRSDENTATTFGENTTTTLWMGFSVRDVSHRYTAWVPYNGTRALWPEQHPYRGYQQVS